MFLHARKGHVEPFGKGCDRSVRTPELLQDAAAGSVRERAERGIEVGLAILSHMVQYTTWVMECKRRLSARCVARRPPEPTVNSVAFTSVRYDRRWAYESLLHAA